MPAFNLLKRLTQAGHKITVSNGMINIDPPGPAAEIRALKPEILEIFAKQERARGKKIHGHETAHIDTPWGDFWLVPIKTGYPRFEVEWDELQDIEKFKTLLLACTVLEGRVVVV